MCGIAGLVQVGLRSSEVLPFVTEATLDRMSSAVRHRGPDGSGTFITTCGRVGLVHRRLSIIDLSEAGAQPMRDDSGRFTIVFNGEIYNHLTLRQAIEAETGRISWRGHSDTESLLAAIAHWGLIETLRRACGMFALALWDAENGVVSLARDRMGEKPLYIGKLPQGIAFASELRAIEVVPEFSAVLDLNAIHDYIRTAAVHDDAAIFETVRKIQPGTILSIEVEGAGEEEVAYESFLDLVVLGQRRSQTADPGSHVARVETVLQEVVESQMMSDVPIGSFLSGGIDSSLVTALMQRVSQRKVRSFSIGFDDLGYDESRYAEEVANHLATDHQTYRLREEDALEVIPELPRIWDEPFSDSSQIPTLLLCRKARSQVTVALTGDGGDELFGGYNRYVLAPRLWSVLRRIPQPLRKTLPFFVRLPQWLGGSGSGVMRMLAARTYLPSSAIDKAGRLARVAADASSLANVYEALITQLDNPDRILAFSAHLGGAPLCPAHPRPKGAPIEEWMMIQDSLGYLPSDILVKVDRASMSSSLETRAPYLDRRVVVAAWSLPLEMRIQAGKGKRILRDILRRHVPERLYERPKQGFSIPVDSWLRGPLASWADEMLSVDQLHARGVFITPRVREIWQAHRSNRVNNGGLLWSIIMLQAWLSERGLALRAPNPAFNELL